jgi:tetratricopeptide (TPR) repeat protein
MATTLTPAEEAQLAQTIEMFEVIIQSQPYDYQSLEILKEAYSKLGREKDAVGTSKKIAQAYLHMGQLSSAILEYETILQRFPDDAEIQAALKQIEAQASSFQKSSAATGDTGMVRRGSDSPPKRTADKPLVPAEVEDGRRAMHKLFVDGKVLSHGDFDLCWPVPDLSAPPRGVVEPFVQILHNKGILPVEKALKLICDKSRSAYLPLNHYDTDMDLARGFPAVTCQRWCVLPFDRMSKSIMVATANPFNQQAAKELAEATSNRLIWYVVPPSELIKNLRKAFR